MFALDKLRGCLIGLSLGDALGAPYELRNSFPLSYYNGTIYQPVRWKARYGPILNANLGTVTDDTSMSIALLWVILKNKGWNEEEVLLSYMNWANSGIKFLGKNTRALFHGVKTINGYRSRRAKLDLSKMESNGSLMRAFPLILLFQYLPEDQAYLMALKDTNLSNDNPVNRDATLIYLTILRFVLQGILPQEGVPQLISIVQTDPIKQAIIEAAQGFDRNITINKGWVAHCIYCSVQSWIQIGTGKTFAEVINWVILKGGDCDTTACVAGSVIGLFLGFNKMLEEPTTKENINIILNANTTQGDLCINALYHPANALAALK
jgi:ADP-ribosylglycohydrolase